MAKSNNNVRDWKEKNQLAMLPRLAGRFLLLLVTTTDTASEWADIDAWSTNSPVQSGDTGAGGLTQPLLRTMVEPQASNMQTVVSITSDKNMLIKTRCV